MNRSALKSYAPKARLEFIRAVTDRAAFFGLTPNLTEPMQEMGDVVIIGGRAFPRVAAEQRKKLEARIQRLGFDQVMEAMAYTWFNRLVALRYMELHGYLDHGYRVLSPAPDEVQTTDLTTETRRTRRGENSFPGILRDLRASVVKIPEILEHAEHVTLPGLDAQDVINLKLEGSREAELYRLLLVAQCNALHEAMPFLFEKISDETELLLPDNLLHTDSVIRKLVNGIEESDWEQVEIIGWLYQFYISDKKDEVIGKVVKSEDIPAATQLFTPNWIVKYLVQNTLGRQWLATYPDSPLRQQMEYYIEPAEQTDDVKAQLAAITPKSLDPETLTLLDDACGSGHILVEAYDLFKAIYQERGYRSKDIPRLILEKNLFGLEIDDRAAQLAAFALLMKARADDRRIFADRIQPNVVAIQESNGLESLLRPDPGAGAGAGELPFADSDLFPDTQRQLTLSKPSKGSPLAEVEPCLRELIKLFEHGKTFGSLIRVPPELAAQLPSARQSIDEMVAKGQIWEHRAATLLLPLVRQAEVLARQHDAVVTNPPYMGAKHMNAALKEFVAEHFADAKADLFSCFIQRASQLVKSSGCSGLVTMQAWMFLSAFEALRDAILRNTTLASMAHLGPRAFGEISGEVVQTTAFVSVLKHIAGYRSTFVHLVEEEEEAKKTKLKNGECRFVRQQDCFKKIPGSPLAYWVDERLARLFSEHPSLEGFADARPGLQTSDNARFLRLWHEVPYSKIGFGCATRMESVASEMKWFPCNKGGPYRRWYGNFEFVVNWERDGKELFAFATELYGSPTRIIKNADYYFRGGITWSDVTMGDVSFRNMPAGFVFDATGHCAFFRDIDTHYMCLALMNTHLMNELAQVLNPTMHFHVGYFRKLPWPSQPPMKVIEIAKEAVKIAKGDWDAQETSWDFEQLPILRGAISARRSVQESWLVWQQGCDAAWQRLKSLEAENNQAFNSAFGLGNNYPHEVSDNQVTLFRPSAAVDTRKLLSYALGCMMGRYSLDRRGLVYAYSRNEGFDPSHYCTFPADADGIIPITELAWFSDDATERFVEFIGKAWPAEHLEPNLKFIADSLGPNRDEHPRDILRRYLSQNFYKDHLQTYKRRPIYWLFSSGKQKTFHCLVYLHRYHEGTLARMRTEYVIPLQGKITHRIEQLAGDIAAATSTSHRRKLEKEREALVKQHTELIAFDEKLRHYADQRIALDLDDGVKVNYGKFGDLLAEVKAVTGGGEE